MRIAHFAWESLHSIPVGGVATHVTELAAGLQRRGHEVHVFVRLGAWQPTYQLIDGVHYHRCPISLNRDFVTEMNDMGNVFAYFLGETEAYQGGSFDVVHAHDWLCAKGMVQVKNDRGRKVVFTMHSTEYGRCGNQNHNGMSARIRAIEAEGAYCADRVVTVSTALAEEVKWLYGVPEYKLRVIHNGINCARFDGAIDPGICRRSYGVGPLDPMVLFVGRLTNQKGPDLLLEAVPGILSCRGDAKIVFVGDGDMRGHLEHRASQLGVRHAVRFTGAMSPDGDLLNLFKSTDVVCVPSRNEPFGLAVLEAWAAGKPVVVTENGGPRYFCSHGIDGFVVHPTPDSIRWGICSIFGNFEHGQWMGSRGRVKAAYSFSWDAIAEQIENTYADMLQ
jgi:glycosyltransferase involved in cell wall biosynthesis